MNSTAAGFYKLKEARDPLGAWGLGRAENAKKSRDYAEACPAKAGGTKKFHKLTPLVTP